MQTILRFPKPAALPASNCRLIQADDFQILFSLSLFFFSYLLDLFTSQYYFHFQGFCLCEDTLLMFAISSLSAATPPRTALFIVGHPSILSNTPQLSSMRRSYLSAGCSHHRMHIPYSIYPRVRCLMVFLSLLVQFGKILILSDLEKSHCRIMTNIIHTGPSYR